MTKLQHSPPSATCPFALHPDFTPLPLEDPPEEGKVGRVQFGPYRGAAEFKVCCSFSKYLQIFLDILSPSFFLWSGVVKFLPIVLKKVSALDLGNVV